MIYIYYDNTKFNSQIHYTFEVLFKILGLDIKFVTSLKEQINEKCLIINYSNKIIDKSNTITIKPSHLFSNKYLQSHSMPITPLKKYKDVPVIYANYDQNLYVRKINTYLITNIDIIQSSFFMLTRYEEILLWDKIDKDLYGRFPAQESLAYKEDFLDYPIVNEYIEWLWGWINSFNLGYKRKNIWGKYDFAACLTHDVDRPFKYTYSIKNDIKKLKYENANTTYRDIFLNALSNLNYTNDPFYSFIYMRNIERKYNFTSSFYFLTGGDSELDEKYDIKQDFRMKELINHLLRDNCEVGYHYSFNANKNLDKMILENNIIKEVIRGKRFGGRSHYLKFNIKDICTNCERSGLQYDSSLGYAEYIGFRCGLCFPYKIFDIIENKVLNIYEIPLIVMDTSLIEQQYLNLSEDEMIRKSICFINTVKKYKGVFTLLWHNSTFDNYRNKKCRMVFEKIMKEIYISGGIGLSGMQIIEKLNV